MIHPHWLKDRGKQPRGGNNNPKGLGEGPNGQNGHGVWKRDVEWMIEVGGWM